MSKNPYSERENYRCKGIATPSVSVRGSLAVLTLGLTLALMLGNGGGSIFKRHHWLVFAANPWCGYPLRWLVNPLVDFGVTDQFFSSSCRFFLKKVQNRMLVPLQPILDWLKSPKESILGGQLCVICHMSKVKQMSEGSRRWHIKVTKIAQKCISWSFRGFLVTN